MTACCWKVCQDYKYRYSSFLLEFGLRRVGFDVVTCIWWNALKCYFILSFYILNFISHLYPFYKNTAIFNVKFGSLKNICLVNNSTHRAGSTNNHLFGECIDSQISQSKWYPWKHLCHKWYRTHNSVYQDTLPLKFKKIYNNI